MEHHKEGKNIMLDNLDIMHRFWTGKNICLIISGGKKQFLQWPNLPTPSPLKRQMHGQSLSAHT